MGILLTFGGIILALYLLSLVWNPFSHDKEMLDWKKEQDKLKNIKK